MVKKYLDSIKTTSKNLGKKLSQRFKTSTATFYTYEDITLKLYLEIAASLDFKRLVINGKARESELVEAWEFIIRKNYEVNGGFDYINYCDLIDGYNSLLSDYNYVRATLIQLMFVVDDNYIEELRNKGYRIDTTDSLKYAESISNALRRSENLITRMKMKSNEISDMIGRDGGSKGATFEEIMAGLSLALKFAVPEDIKLSRFNEYKKMISERNQKLDNG